jgi:hypothetical protein
LLDMLRSSLCTFYKGVKKIKNKYVSLFIGKKLKLHNITSNNYNVSASTKSLLQRLSIEKFYFNLNKILQKKTNFGIVIKKTSLFG